jgi:hypothetical protein
MAAGGTAATGDPARFVDSHRRLLEDESIQFEMAAFAPQPVPGWLRWLAETLEAMGPVFRVLFWIAMAVAVLAVLYTAARWVEAGGLERFRRRRPVSASEEERPWQPQEAPARALLRDADALAAEGRYAEAAHLLLFRSIEDIDRRRPHLVRPALTSRDIAGAPQLPPGPRAAFSRIVMMVEGSIFGARSVGEADWRDCREAYEQFAFAREWKA